MSCKQVIQVDQDCIFMTYLDGCNEQRIYPPLRLQDNEYFIVVDGFPEPKQISISKDPLDVDLNGQNYTDKDEFIAELLLQIKCVNDTQGGGGSFPTDYSNAPNQLSILSAVEQVRDFVEFDPEVISSVPFCSGGQQYYRVIISNIESASGEPDDNLTYWVDPAGNVGTTAPTSPEDGYCNINESIDALYSGSTFDFASPNSGALTLPTLIGKIDVELIDATVIEIPTDINNRVLDVQDVIDVLNNYVQEVVFNRYSDDSQIVVFEDGNLSHNGIAAITIFNDDSSEFLKWDLFTPINEDLSSNEGKQRRALQKVLSKQSTQKRSENHLSTGAQISGPGIVPPGFYSVLIKRVSGTLVVNGNITLNNQFRSISYTAEQTDLTNGGTPQFNITGGGNWEWIGFNKLK